LERRWGIDTVEGRNGESIYEHWKNGPKTLHGTMTSGFPNQFYIGYIQGGLNASVTEQFGRQGEHIAWIVSHALEKHIDVVEPTEEAMNDYVQTFEKLEIDISSFQRECPPGYFNNEGEDKPKWALFRGWGHGWDAFQKVLHDWREKGDLAGMAVTHRKKQD
ncbi:MAG: monooxygenase, partial [Sphingomonas sp.]